MRLIDADTFKEDMKRKYGAYARQPQDDIDAQPTVDAECVVRCKDCLFFSMNHCDDFGFKCEEWCNLVDTPMTKESFCSNGERKDGGLSETY